MATGTIFDLVEEKVSSPVKQKKRGSEDQSEYISMSESVDLPEDKSALESGLNFGKNILKAGVRGIQKAGRMVSPEIVPGKSEQEIQGEFSQQLEELVPSTPGGRVSKYAERGLEMFPELALLPGGSLAQTGVRSLLAGVLGQTAKDVGVGETGQSIAELPAFLSPSFGKKLTGTKATQPIIDWARKHGLSDKEITPLVQGFKKQKYLSGLASKGQSTQSKMQATKDALNRVHSNISGSPEAKKSLNPKILTDFYNDVSKKAMSMPANVRKVIAQDMLDFEKSNKTGSDLMNLWADINYEFGSNTSQLGVFKDSISKAMSSLDPKLAEDFRNMNDLWTKFYPIRSKLSPQLTDKIMGAGAAYGFASGVLTGDVGILQKILGITGAKKLSEQLLTNPKLYNLTGQLAKAASQNKWKVADRIANSIANNLKEKAPESIPFWLGTDWEEELSTKDSSNQTPMR